MRAGHRKLMPSLSTWVGRRCSNAWGGRGEVKGSVRKRGNNMSPVAALPGRWRLAIAAALVVVIGCGAGGLGLTGGSVPIGTSRLVGVAVRSDSPATPVANAKVTLQTGSSQ